MMDELVYFIAGVVTGYVIIVIFAWADEQEEK